MVQIRNELNALHITTKYRKIEFGTFSELTNLECEVISDGFTGTFETGNLNAENKGRVGFYRDYSPDANSPFGTGGLD